MRLSRTAYYAFIISLFLAAGLLAARGGSKPTCPPENPATSLCKVGVITGTLDIAGVNCAGAPTDCGIERPGR